MVRVEKKVGTQRKYASEYDFGRIDATLTSLDSNMKNVNDKLDSLNKFCSESEKDRARLHDDLEAAKKDLKDHKDAQSKQLRNIAIVVTIITGIIDIIGFGLLLYTRVHAFPVP